MENRFDFDASKEVWQWVWTRTNGQKIRLTKEDVADLAQLTHSASRMSNPGPGGYCRADEFCQRCGCVPERVISESPGGGGLYGTDT